MTDPLTQTAIEIAPLSREAEQLSGKFLSMPLLVSMYDALERDHETGKPLLQTYFGQPIPAFVIALDLGHYAQRRVDKGVYAAGLRIATCLFHAGSIFDEISIASRASGKPIKRLKYAKDGSVLRDESRKPIHGAGGRPEKHRGDRVGGLALCAVFEWLGNELRVSETGYLYGPGQTLPEDIPVEEVERLEKMASPRKPKRFHEFYWEVLRQVQPERQPSTFPNIKKIDKIIYQYRDLATAKPITN